MKDERDQKHDSGFEFWCLPRFLVVLRFFSSRRRPISLCSAHRAAWLSGERFSACGLRRLPPSRARSVPPRPVP